MASRLSADIMLNLTFKCFFLQQPPSQPRIPQLSFFQESKCSVGANSPGDSDVIWGGEFYLSVQAVRLERERAFGNECTLYDAAAPPASTSVGGY